MLMIILDDLFSLDKRRGAYMRHLNFVQAWAISLDLLVTLNHPILCHSNVSQNKNFSLKFISSIVYLDLT